MSSCSNGYNFWYIIIYESASLKRKLPTDIPKQWTPENIASYDDKLQEKIVKHQEELFALASKRQRDEILINR